METSYKEKYEDILARLERAKNDNDVCDERFCCVIDDLIPELAESEDEKVGKELIKHLKELSDWKEDEVIPVKNPSYYRQWASWLEKQEEHANFRNKIQVGDKVTRNEDGVLVNLSQLRRVAKPSEKQCEQKFEMKTAEESLGISSDEYNKIVDECLFGEQKLTEFERGLFDMLTDISKPRTADCVKSHSEKLLSIARKMIALEQKPEENKVNIGEISSNSAWSEDDETVLNNLIYALANDRIGNNRDEYVAWLKSLRPQNTYNPYKAVVESIAEMCKHYDKASHSGLRDFYDNVKVKCKDAQEYDKMFPQAQWKPSDEQMWCLSDAIEHYNSLGYPAPKLKELLDDLKKIKGEV